MKDPDDLYTVDMFQEQLILESDKFMNALFTRKTKEIDINDDSSETTTAGC